MPVCMRIRVDRTGVQPLEKKKDSYPTLKIIFLFEIVKLINIERKKVRPKFCSALHQGRQIGLGSKLYRKPDPSKILASANLI